MKITSVEKIKNQNGMLAVYIDGEYSFSISEEDYLSMGMYEKADIDDEELRQIKYTLNYRLAKSTAVEYISFCLRTEAQVRAKLETDGFSRRVIDKAIKELSSLGYLNDKLYAQKYLYDRSKLKPKSKRMLKKELKEKGICENIIDEVLEDWNVDDNIVAERLIRKKFGKYDLSSDKIMRKAYLFLRHRGYSDEVIGDVIRKISGE